MQIILMEVIYFTLIIYLLYWYFLQKNRILGIILKIYSSRLDTIRLLFHISQAMHKTRNTGTGNGMRGTRGMGGGVSPSIQENFAEYSGKCPQTFRRLSSSIPANVLKHSGECPRIFWMSLNIPWNFTKHSVEYPQTNTVAQKWCCKKVGYQS